MLNLVMLITHFCQNLKYLHFKCMSCLGVSSSIIMVSSSGTPLIYFNDGSGNACKLEVQLVRLWKEGKLSNIKTKCM